MVKKAVNEGKNPADQPTGFVQTFKSRFVNVDGLRLHAVIGGGGPPLLLLLGGWPQIWYSWRFVMPALGYERFAMAGHDMSGIGDDFYRMNGAGDMLVFSAADFEDWLEPRPDLSPLMEDELKAVIRLLVQNR